MKVIAGKLVKGLFAWVGVGVLVAACSTGSSNVSNKSNVTLTVLASQDWVRDGEKKVAQKFQDQTGIHIDYQIIPSANYFQVLSTKLNSGQGPDIFMGQSGVSDLKVNYRVEQNALDLSKEGWVKREDPAAAAQSTVDGKLYGQEIWDIYSGYWVVVYNKDLFQKAGISGAPATFSDFVADCDKLKAAGITPMYEPISDGWHHVLWFPENGVQIENLEPGLADKLNANQATFAGDPASNTAMSQINQLYQKGYFGSSALSDQYSNTTKQLGSLKYAMTVNSLTLPDQIHADVPNVQASSFGFFPMPILDNQLLPTHPAGPTKFIWSKGSHIAEAKQFLTFLAQPANLQYSLDNEPTFVALDFSGVKAKWTPDQQTFISHYKAATTLVYQDQVNYVNPQWIDIGKDMTAMFTGKESPHQVMVAIDTRRSQEAQAANDPAWKK